MRTLREDAFEKVKPGRHGHRRSAARTRRIGRRAQVSAARCRDGPICQSSTSRTSSSRRSSAALPTSTSPPALRPSIRVRGRLFAARGLPRPGRLGHARDRLLDHERHPAPAVRERAPGRLQLFGPAHRPYARQRLSAARRGQRGAPRHPQRRSSRWSALGMPRGRARDGRPCRAGSCSSPAPPAPASRPRWPRSSTRSTTPARTTSSPSRTRSSSCTATSAASSTSASWAATPRSFAEGLRAALREDPDVILVGEMRDLETISTALTAAETGHLVLATLHTQDAPQTIDRIIDVFPPHQQQHVRVMLSVALQGVVAQQLLPTADGSGRVARRRDPHPDSRGAQPHPRGQDPPDLLRHPDRRRVRHADDGRRARRARARRPDHPRRRPAPGLGARPSWLACSAAAPSLPAAGGNGYLQ